MIIGIDGNEANVENHVGTSVYTLELLKYFAKHASSKTQFVIYTRTPRRQSLPEPSPHFRYVTIPGTKFWRDYHFPLYLYLHREIDILFCPAHYAPRFCPVPFVVAIHDVAYEFYPHEFLSKDLYKLRSWTGHALKHARHIITVSQETKKDIQKLYKLSAKRITTVLNGFRSFSHASATGDLKRLKKYHVESHRYILYVGTLQPRKNISTLIRAFSHLHTSDPDLKLLIAGKKGWLFENIFETIEELGLSKHVIMPGYVPDEDLATLYRQACVFVMPSLYEGFGIPLLEAMHQKCPVVSANTSCLPEVGGEACVYVDPHDEYAMSREIARIMHTPALRQKLVTAGTHRIKAFSFEKMGKETLDVLIQALSK